MVFITSFPHAGSFFARLRPDRGRANSCAESFRRNRLMPLSGSPCPGRRIQLFETLPFRNNSLWCDCPQGDTLVTAGTDEVIRPGQGQRSDSNVGICRRIDVSEVLRYNRSSGAYLWTNVQSTPNHDRLGIVDVPSARPPQHDPSGVCCPCGFR